MKIAIKAWIVVNVFSAFAGGRALGIQILYLLGAPFAVPLFEGRDFGHPMLSWFLLAYYAIGFTISANWALNGIVKLSKNSR